MRLQSAVLGSAVPPSGNHGPSSGSDGATATRNKIVNVASSVLGPGIAGLLEVAIFHPLDTVAKRLMSYQHRVILPHAPLSHQLSHLNSIVFRQHRSEPTWQRMATLYQGLDYAVAYKVAQRIYKFGGQPLIYYLISQRTASVQTNILTELSTNSAERKAQLNSIRRCKIRNEALAGAAVGIGEVILSPLDLLKIKAQTNQAAMQGQTIWSLIKTENVRLYRGATWALMRNIPGSMALFGTSSATKYFGFNLDGLDVPEGSPPDTRTEPRRPTLTQLMISSAVGAVCSLLVSSPFDVIKTRVQNRNFDSQVRGIDVLRELLRNEGPSAFYRGITPKLMTVGPKLMFSYAISQYLTMHFANGLQKFASK